MNDQVEENCDCQPTSHIRDNLDDKKTKDIEGNQKLLSPTPRKNLNQERKFFFHRHFNCSRHAHVGNALKAKDSEYWEADTYNYVFSFEIFTKFLVFCLLNICGLKPLVWIYTCFSKSKFISNFSSKLGPGILYIISTFGYVNTFLLGFCFWERSFIYADANFLNYLLGLLFVSVIGACISAYTNKKIPSLINTVDLSEVSVYDITATTINLNSTRELKRTILRLDLDASLFFMEFLENVDDVFHKKKGISDYLHRGISLNDDILVSSNPIRLCDLISQAQHFEESVFDYNFKNSSRFDDEKSFGYTFAQEILSSFSNYNFSEGWILLFGFLFLNQIVLSFLRLDFEQVHSEGIFKKYVMAGIWMLFSAFFSLFISLTVVQGVELLQIRLLCLEKMEKLISYRRSPEELMLNPMINIFDFASLRTWASLRMVFMKFNEQRLESLSLAISIILGAELIIITIFGFFYFSTPSSVDKDYYLRYVIFFGAESALYIIISMIFVYIGAQVNNQYQNHIYLLKNLKSNICTIFQLYPTWIGPKAVQPNTYLYTKGLKNLKSLFDTNITPTELNEKLHLIIDLHEKSEKRLATLKIFYPNSPFHPQDEISKELQELDKFNEKLTRINDCCSTIQTKLTKLWEGLKSSPEVAESPQLDEEMKNIMIAHNMMRIKLKESSQRLKSITQLENSIVFQLIDGQKRKENVQVDTEVELESKTKRILLYYNGIQKKLKETSKNLDRMTSVAENLQQESTKLYDWLQEFTDSHQIVDGKLEEFYQVLQNVISLNLQQVPQELLNEKLHTLTSVYDTIIAELETEEQHCPLKILGIPMTDSFVTTVLGSILTVAAIPITKYISDLTGWF